jgi:beta-N-acetylhexosaminidase
MAAAVAMGLALAAGLAWKFDGKTAERENTANTPAAPPEQSRAEEIVAGMTLEEKIGQMFLVDTDALGTGYRQAGIGKTDTEIDKGQIGGLDKYRPGGVVMFGGNVESAEQITQYNADLQSSSKYPLFIAADQEGGIVSRLTAAGVAKTENMSEVASDERAYEIGKTFAIGMRGLGFNVDFAPVADVNTNPDNPVIGVRSFGSDASVVAGRAASEVKGLQENGVAATLKHFPGHGDTNTDSHTRLPTVAADIARLNTVELVPFRAGIAAGAKFVLTAHIRMPNVDASGVPATMSKVLLTDILRNKLGFKGIIITDALDMGAIQNHYTPKEIVRNCVGAGADILLMPKYFYRTYDAFTRLVEEGAIREDRIDESVLRIVQTKLDLGLME